MATTPERSSDSPPRQGISFHALSEAFARAMGRGKKSAPETNPEDQPSGEPAGTPPEREAAGPLPSAEGAPPEPEAETVPLETEATDDHDPCQLCPRSILEAMLFVGNQQNEPLTSARAAGLMRGVTPEEVADLVDELNRRYAAAGTPYHIVSEGAGYRLVLRKSFHSLRDKFYGRVREARLSQAAVDILAIVAYRQPLTAEEVSNLRGKPSGGILAQLVRRQLLRIERPEGRRHPASYHTTDRFLELFGMASLDDLPQAEDVESH